MSRIAIVDGDVAAYMACKNRYGANPGGFHPVNEENKKVEQEFTPDQDAEYLGECWDNLLKILKELEEICFADFSLVAVKKDDINNFRTQIYSEYKANRRGQIKNLFVPMLRDKMVMEGIACYAHNREADDMLRIWSEQAKANSDEYVICTIDKDLKCIPGKHYLMHKNQFIDVSEEDSVRFFYEQLLKGDPTDNIPGIPRVGDVKAKKILAEYNTEQEFRDAVIEAYLNAFGDQWYDYLLSNGKMIYLQKHPDDYFKVQEWLQEQS